MNKILVTGANGYIGSGIVKHLVDINEYVIATDLVTDFIDKKCVIKSADLFSIDDPFSYFGKPDIVVHLAWRDGFKHDSSAHIDDLPKHYTFIKRMVESGVSKIVIMGTMHEVGFHEGSINDTTACNPLSLYGIAKNSLRQSVELLVKGTSTTLQWIRGFYIVGNTDRGASVFSKIVQCVNKGNKTFPFTSGINQYDFLDYNEFCEQVACVVLNNDCFGIINCCSGIPRRLSERVEQFINENHYTIKLEYGAFPDRIYDSMAVWGNADKIKRIIGEKK